MYIQDIKNCDGSNSLILVNKKCNIPIIDLLGTMYNFPWGSSIKAKVIAHNFYGDSMISDPGNGAVILTIPDSPINLIEVYSKRSANVLGFSW
jgi:hypothetical protein